MSHNTLNLTLGLLVLILSFAAAIVLPIKTQWKIIPIALLVGILQSIFWNFILYSVTEAAGNVICGGFVVPVIIFGVIAWISRLIANKLRQKTVRSTDLP